MPRIHFATFTLPPQYIYQNSKFLVPVVYFAELVLTCLWAVWAEQHASYTQFPPSPARKKTNAPKLKNN